VIVAVLVANPVPKDTGVREESFEWKGQKRTRTIRTVVLGNEKVEFVRIPKGIFRMGSPASDKDAEGKETPPHQVTFTKPLWVGKFPVTKGQFAAFVQATKYQTDPEKRRGGWGYDGTDFDQAKDFSWLKTGWEQSAQHPVVNVSWNDATAFCEWATKNAPGTMRLLSEAEWEYACRGGETTRYFTGDDVAGLEGYANLADTSAKTKWKWRVGVEFDDGEPFSSPVGKYKPNGFGLHDMTGNVSCWCSDVYNGNLYVGWKAGVTDPEPYDDSEREKRVVRGCSWIGYSENARAAYRHSWLAPLCECWVGFRVAFSPN
jgi:formylglycine-generating enzyme required for sulfatase activity